MTPDALPYLPSAAAWHRATGWCRTHGAFRTAYWAQRRCYACDKAEAVYEAHLDHDATPVVLLCGACALWEREAGSVVWIRTLAA